MKLPCAICGLRPTSSKDHLPPRCFFTKPRPPDMVTVKACTTCNNGASRDDLRFKVYLGLIVGGFSDAGREFWTQEALPSLRRDQKLQVEIATSMKSFANRDDIPPTPAGTFPVGFPAEVHNKTIERITRGLYFYHFKEILGTRASIETGFIRRLTHEIQQSTNEFQSNDIGGGRFNYRFGRAGESPLHSVWLFEFYSAFWASAYVTPIGAKWQLW